MISSLLSSLLHLAFRDVVGSRNFRESVRSAPSRALTVGTLVELPLLWFSKERPSADIHRSRPVPTSPVISASCCQTLRTFRPCRSSPTALRAALQVCCALQPAMGFESAVAASVELCFHISTSSAPFPDPLLTPLQAFPSLEAAPRHRDRCHPAVVLPAVSDRSTRPHGLAPPENPLPTDPVSRVCPLDASLGFVPSRRSSTPLPIDSPGASPP